MTHQTDVSSWLAHELQTHVPEQIYFENPGQKGVVNGEASSVLTHSGEGAGELQDLLSLSDLSSVAPISVHRADIAMFKLPCGDRNDKRAEMWVTVLCGVLPRSSFPEDAKQLETYAHSWNG